MRKINFKRMKDESPKDRSAIVLNVPGYGMIHGQYYEVGWITFSPKAHGIRRLFAYSGKHTIMDLCEGDEWCYADEYRKAMTISDGGNHD